jgi:hypothetical protein
MPSPTIDKNAILDAIRQAAHAVDHAPSRREFQERSGMREYHVLEHFESWNEAVRAAGFEPYTRNAGLEDSTLLEDWGAMVRVLRQIPTRAHYRREGRYSPGAFEKHFGPWSTIPRQFREFANGRPEWQNVVVLLPPDETSQEPDFPPSNGESLPAQPRLTATSFRYPRLENRRTYGNPIDFRGLRHEPVNEDGVVFLFGMVAKELGYLVEAVQAGFPDCEAKRQVSAGRWQRVRIEFEFESRNFRDHGHPVEGCDIIVCWRHNWPECPTSLQIVELQTVIRSLAKSED